MADTNELLERLSAAVGMIMEVNGPVALTPLPPTSEEIDAKLTDLHQACRDAGFLIQAAQVLARRGIRPQREFAGFRMRANVGEC